MKALLETDVQAGAGPDAVAPALLTAFAADPFVRYWIPDPRHYLEYFPKLIQGLGSAAFEGGSAWLAAGGAAAALWSPPGAAHDEAAVADVARSAVPQERQSEFEAVADLMHASRPDEPHWHLPLIGVDPASQGCGIGSELLAHSLEVCDRQRLSAYLEATSPRNIPLYRRHGFRERDVIRAGQAPPLVPMLRLPAR